MGLIILTLLGLKYLPGWVKLVWLFQLSNKAVQATFDKFGLTDTFAASGQYDRFYTELTGTIVLLIESNNLPTVRLTEEASPKTL